MKSVKFKNIFGVSRASKDVVGFSHPQDRSVRIIRIILIRRACASNNLSI